MPEVAVDEGCGLPAANNQVWAPRHARHVQAVSAAARMHGAAEE